MAYFLTILIREDIQWLRDVPFDLFKKPSKVNYGQPYAYELFKYIYSQSERERGKANEEMEKTKSYLSKDLSPVPNNKMVFGIFIKRHWHLVWQAIEDHEQEAFTEFLFKATEDHKAFWSQNRGLNKGEVSLKEDHQGFISLPLTAMCARAYDKGMKIEVESGYLPKEIYTGSFLSS